jgi:hypothetical protein
VRFVLQRWLCRSVPSPVPRVRLAALVLVFAAVLPIGTATNGPRAYRDIHFGMSAHEVVEAVTSDAAFIRPYTGESYQACHESGGWFCDDPEMWFWTGVFTRVAGITMNVDFFYAGDDRLYRVLLAVDEDRSAAFLGTLVREEVELLASVIRRSRGEPSWTRELTVLDMEAGDVTYAHMWPADEPGVGHAVGIGEKRSTYYAALDIWWAPLAEVVRRGEDTLLEERIDEAAGDF